MKKFILIILISIASLWFLWGSLRLIVMTNAVTTFPLKLKWQVDLGNSTHDYPMYQNDLVIFPASRLLTTYWYGIDATDGQVIWTQKANSTSSFLRCLTGEYIVISGPRSLITLNSFTGEVLWRGERVQVASCNEELVFFSGVSRDTIRAFELSTGKQIWSGTEPRKNFNGLIYDVASEKLLASHGDRLYQIEPKTGLLKHSFEEVVYAPTDGRWERGPLYVIDNEELFLGATVLDAQTGQIIHKEDHFDSITAPIVTTDTMYLSAIYDGVIAFDRTNYQVKWTYKPQQKFQLNPLYTRSSVAILNKIGYIIFSDGTLRAFDIDTGKELGYWQMGIFDLWQWPVCTIPPSLRCLIGSGTARTGLATSENTLFVSFGDGKLYAFSQ